MTDSRAPLSADLDQPGIDRRKLLVAGAWAAPAVMLASATPAFAASNCPSTFAASNIVVTKNCATSSRTYTVANNSDCETATVTLKLEAQAWALTRNVATSIVVKATESSASGVTYPVTGSGTLSPTNDNFSKGWSTPTTSPSTGNGGFNAKRERQMIVVLPPGTSVTFGQQGLSFPFELGAVGSGAPTYDATVTSITAGVPTTGAYPARVRLAYTNAGTCVA